MEYFEIKGIPNSNKGHEVSLREEIPYALWDFLRTNILGGSRKVWDHRWTYERALEAKTRLEQEAASAAKRFEEIAAAETDWFYCEHGGHYYRPLTVSAKQRPSGDINGKNACWPCYDGFFDCCYGPKDSEFEYRE